MKVKSQKLKVKSNKRYRIFIFLFLIVIFNFSLLIFNSSQVHAQSVSLGVYPPILQVMIQPGKSLTQVYRISNFSDPVIISSEVVPFMPQESGTVDLLDCERLEVIGCESLSWYSFQNADFSLGAPFFLGSGRTQEVVLKINVPDYASEGDYYNTLLFTTQAPPQGPDKRSRATATIGSNILITVSKTGNPTRTISIVDFSAKNKFSIFNFQFSIPLFDSFEQIPVTLKVLNSGTAYTSVKGRISLFGFPGLKGDYKINAQNVLAGNTRILTATPSATLRTSPSASMIYHPLSIIQSPSLLLPRGFYFGRYRLTAEVENEDGTIVKAQTHFWAIPFRFIFFLIIFVFLVTVILKISKNKRR